MNEQEITRTIAEWMGECIHDYEHHVLDEGKQVWRCKKCGKQACYMKLEPPPAYTTSLDALRPVLAKFTPEMWVVLADGLCFEHLGNFATHATNITSTERYILTLPASTLARLVAETIKESKL